MKPTPWLMAALLCFASAASLALEPFTARYTSKYGFLSASGSRSLTAAEDNTWLIKHGARLLLVDVAEQSHFRLDQGVVIPLDYEFTNPLSSNRSQSQQFDWQRNIATDKERNTSVVLKQGVFDKLSYQVQLKLDVCEDPGGFKSADYTVVDRDRLKTYRVSRVKEELLGTAAGPLRTLRLRQVRADKKDDEPTYLWLATDWECLLVRLDQEEDGKVLSLKLKEAMVGGQAVRGVE